MCGIVAVVGAAVGGSLDEATWRRSVHTLAHRGPDGEGSHFDRSRRVALGHSRLAVIDIETGKQPMSSQDGAQHIVWNGELYGFEALRTDLEGRGHRFVTRSDTEVVLALYREYGMAFLEQLRGEFAFVLHDRTAGRVLAARDRFGIRPLFVSRTLQGIVLASEAKAIFATGLLSPRLHLPDVRDTYRLAWVDSVFEDVSVVPPGGWLSVSTSSGAEQSGRYWELDLEAEHRGDAVRPFDEYREAVGACFDEAVALRLRSDVPVGVYLSGGLDSSSVAACAVRHRQGPLKAFSLSFPESRWADEGAQAQRVAEQLGVEYHQVDVDRETLLAAFEDSIWHSELPTRSLGGAGKQLLARTAAQHVKVVLTGEGADEVFLGYPLHTKAICDPGDKGRLFSRRTGWVRRALAPARAVRRRLGHSLFAGEHQHRLAHTPRGSRSVFAVEPEPPEVGADRLMSRTRYALLGRMTSYVLAYFGDRPDMSASIESRVPFLDHHLFELARTIPRHMRWSGLAGPGPPVEKHMLREAVRDWIPDDVYRRPKFGYRAPIVHMVRGRSATLDALCERWMTREAMDAAGVWSPSVMTGLMALRSRLPDRTTLARRLDRQLFYALSVQILQGRCVAAGGSPSA